MRLHDLVPIHNCVINGYVMIENVFGASAVIYDETGMAYTTTHNARLFSKAQSILEDLPQLHAKERAAALDQLRDEADTITQAQYRQFIAREILLWREDTLQSPHRRHNAL
ncbi:MAG: hypothetical protein EKK46_12195 [Rhodocyclaceae bacterium]|nr:MAG: hypothetical protein EKK46_12195 [Rhodocyclaceae bacterium]